MSYFKMLFEHAIDRLKTGGIQVNDYVKIKNKNIEGVSDEFNKELEEIRKSDLNLKVIEVHKLENGFSVVVGQEMASGIFPKKITIPATHLEVVGHNQPPEIPDSWKSVDNSDNRGEPTPLNKDYLNYSKSKDKKD